jgi:predicted DNA-binding transcriptional regulator AlpA
MTLQGQAALETSGMGRSEAWDLIKHEWAFPPEEMADD